MSHKLFWGQEKPLQLNKMHQGTQRMPSRPQQRAILLCHHCLGTQSRAPQTMCMFNSLSKHGKFFQQKTKPKVHCAIQKKNKDSDTVPAHKDLRSCLRNNPNEPSDNSVVYMTPPLSTARCEHMGRVSREGRKILV